jgi:hypothetical protein
MKSLITVAVAAALALPFAAMAAGDKAPSSASASTGAESMFKALDKNNDGSISREEAKGSPHEKDFSMLDKNNDGKLSKEEHAAAPQHAGSRPAPAAGGSPAPSGGAPSKGSY